MKFLKTEEITARNWARGHPRLGQRSPKTGPMFTPPTRMWKPWNTQDIEKRIFLHRGHLFWTHFHQTSKRISRGKHSRYQLNPMPGQLCILWESTTKSSSPRHVTHSVCHKMRHLQAFKESGKIKSTTRRKIILDGLETRELMNSVHKDLRAWLYVCERALESKDVEESGMQIVAEHGGRHTYLKKKTHRIVLTEDHEPQEMMDAGKAPEKTHAKRLRGKTQRSTEALWTPGQRQSADKPWAATVKGGNNLEK